MKVIIYTSVHAVQKQPGKFVLELKKLQLIAFMYVEMLHVY
jgi:hypothetical protein